MQDKTRIKHRYFEEFCKLHQRHMCAAILDGEIVCISLERRKVEERTR